MTLVCVHRKSFTYCLLASEKWFIIITSSSSSMLTRKKRPANVPSAWFLAPIPWAHPRCRSSDWPAGPGRWRVAPADQRSVMTSARCCTMTSAPRSSAATSSPARGPDVTWPRVHALEDIKGITEGLIDWLLTCIYNARSTVNVMSRSSAVIQSPESLRRFSSQNMQNSICQIIYKFQFSFGLSDDPENRLRS